jgi:hypothetical protein
MISGNVTTTIPAETQIITLDHEIEFDDEVRILPTQPVTTIPKAGKYVISSSAEPYKFDWFLVRATVIDASDLPHPY